MSRPSTMLTAQGQSQAPPTSRGKRKLDFSQGSRRALLHKVFFFDLPGQHVEAVKQEITQRGGIVEKCFHNGVRYLITNRHKNGYYKGTSCSQSPNNPEGVASGCYIPGVASPLSISPNGTDSSKSKTVPVAHRTRAAKMLAASREKQAKKKTVDVVKMAKEWGTKILTLEELMVELRKLKPLPPKMKNRKHYEVVTLVRELKPPFMKVEDQSRLYRPLIYETDVWPLPNPDCPPNSCPYDTPKKNGRNSQFSRATGARLTQDLLVSGAATTCARRKSGYCECCSVRYEDLKMHLRSKQHRDYSMDRSNFVTLNKFINENALSLDDFVSKYVPHDTSTVLLVTPPSSPPRPTDYTPPGSPLQPPCPPPQPRCPHPQPPNHNRPFISDHALNETASTTITPKLVHVPAPGLHSAKQNPTPIRKTGKWLSLMSISASKISDRESTPDSAIAHTPVKSVAVEKRDRGTDDHVLSCSSASKKAKQLVPETPDKKEIDTEERRSPLYNIRNLIYRLSTASEESKKNSPFARERRDNVTITNIQELLDEVTRDSSLNSSMAQSPETSPPIRKSPRLMKQQGIGPTLSVESGPVLTIPPPSPRSLMVSIHLNDISLQGKSTTTLVEEQQTPEKDNAEAPVVERLMQTLANSLHDQNTSESELFNGFTPANVRMSLPKFSHEFVTQTLFPGSGGPSVGGSPLEMQYSPDRLPLAALTVIE